MRLAQINLKHENLSELYHWIDFKSSDINREGFRQYIKAGGLMLERKFQDAISLYNSFEVQSSELVDKKNIENNIRILSSLLSST